MIYHRVRDLDFGLADVPFVPAPRRVLLTTPRHFEVQYVINPHMQQHVGQVDAARARAQWAALGATYAALGLEVVEVAGAPGLPDMVFCANQSLPYYAPPGGRRGVFLSRMHAPERRAEVPHYARFFRGQGYRVETLPASYEGPFEGMGDALWHPGHFLLWGGYGFRTHLPAYAHLAERLGLRVLALRLQDPDFYHLDTCLSLLDAHTALIYPGAFDADGRALIRHVFARVLEAPEEEARHRFACNAYCPDGRHVLLQRGCEETNRLLCRAGYMPLEVETDEFLKAGGSVFCMKLTFW